MKFAKIHETLYQGDAEDARATVSPKSDRWRHLGIKGVICPAARERLIVHGIEYHNELPVLLLAWADHEPVRPAIFEMIVSFHRLVGSPTFLHCMGGTNRSAAIAAAILISEGKTVEEAFAVIKPWHEAMVRNVKVFAEYWKGLA